jgi:serine/threonine protein phosphatase PrpC
MFDPSGHQVGCRTHPGLQRRVNEDSLGVPNSFGPGLDPGLLAQKGQLYVVADGMGGHKAGQTASAIAVQTVMREYYATPAGMEVGQALDGAIQVANRQVHAMAQEPAYAEMGTTIVAAVLHGSQLTVANVGDSRAYLIGPSGIRQLTRDHTWVAEQVREGTLTREEAVGHSYRHVVTRSLGGHPQVEMDIFRETVHPGDIVLLCSDGLSGQVSDEEMQRIVQANSPPEAANKLIDLANQRGGPDNITAIVITARPLAPTGFGRMKKAISDIQSYFLGLPVPKRIVFIAALTALLLVGGLFLGGFLVFTQPPVEPPVQVGPVRYMVNEGESRELLAAYFGLQHDEIAPEAIQPGQTLTIRPPAQYGYYVSGLVKSVEPLSVGNVILLKLINSSSEYEVVCPLKGERVPAINPKVAPAKGDIVTVFGWPEGGNRIEAVIVDVARSIFFWTNWRNWYYAAENGPVWVYSSFSKFTLEMNAEHPLEQALVRGTWSKADPARFDYDPDDVYLWDSGAYSSDVSVEARKPLADRLKLELPTATATVELPDIEPTATPYPPTVGIVEPEEGVWVVHDPHNPTPTRIEALRQGTQVEIIGEVQGVPIDGDDVWYQVRYEKPNSTTIEGYMYRGGIRIEPKIIKDMRNG